MVRTMLGRRLIRGIGWMTIGRVAGSAIGLISTLIIAALLIPEDFGLFALSASFVAVFTSAIDFQTSLVLIQMKDPKKQHFDTVFTLNLLRGLVLFLLIAVCAWPLAKLLGDDRLTLLLLGHGLQPLIMGIRNPYFERYAKDVSFVPSTILDLIVKLVTFVVSIGVVIIYPNYWALLCGVLAAAVASSVCTFVMSKERPGWSLASFDSVFSFSMWLGLSALARAVMAQSDRFILAIGFSVVTLGYYAMAIRIIDQIVQALQQPINWALYSGFSKFNDDHKRLQEKYKLAHAAMGALLVPACMGLMLVSDPLIRVFFGAKWEESILYCQVTALVGLIIALPGPSWPLVMSLAETKLLFWRTVITLGIRLGAQLIGIVAYGIPGFLIGTVIAVSINYVIAMQIVKQLISISFVQQMLTVWRPVAASATMIPTVLLTAIFLDGLVPKWFSLALQVAAGGAAYGSASLAFWALSGYPDGPERMVKTQCQAVLRKFKALPVFKRLTQS